MIVGVSLRGHPCPSLYSNTGAATEGRPYKRQLTSWTSGPDSDLGSGSQIKIVTTLNVYRTRASAGPNDRANRRADRGALHCLVGLLAVANRTFVINADRVAIRRAHCLENTGEPVAPA